MSRSIVNMDLTAKSKSGRSLAYKILKHLFRRQILKRTSTTFEFLVIPSYRFLDSRPIRRDLSTISLAAAFLARTGLKKRLKTQIFSSLLSEAGTEKNAGWQSFQNHIAMIKFVVRIDPIFLELVSGSN